MSVSLAPAVGVAFKRAGAPRQRPTFPCLFSPLAEAAPVVSGSVQVSLLLQGQQRAHNHRRIFESRVISGEEVCNTAISPETSKHMIRPFSRFAGTESALSSYDLRFKLTVNQWMHSWTLIGYDYFFFFSDDVSTRYSQGTMRQEQLHILQPLRIN